MSILPLFTRAILTGVPKIFIFDCCLGGEEYRGITIDKTTFSNSFGKDILSGSKSNAGFQCQSIFEDFLVVFSTSPGFLSWNDPDGSRFIKTLYQVFSDKCQNLNITEILDLVADEMQKFEQCKQVPTYISYSFKKLYLPPVCYSSPLTEAIYFYPVK